MAQAQNSLSSFIWSVADLLRGDFKPADYGKVILPFTVLRRLDCVLAPTKPAVLAEIALREGADLNLETFLRKAAKNTFYNTSPMDLNAVIGDAENINANLQTYVTAFSSEVRDIFERFEFVAQVDRLQKSGLLYMITEKFAGFDLHPDKVSNADMGLVFEELIRKFAEASNETAGDHFTPREVIRLMVDLLFAEDEADLTKPNIVRTIYDTECDLKTNHAWSGAKP
jgi:type I restriction enzyme M protein